MVRISVLGDALKTMYNAEKRGKRQVLIRPASKVVIKFLQLMQKHGYINEFEFVDDLRAGKIVVELTGRLNKCGVISPRYDISHTQMEDWVARLLPSRLFGVIVLTTSAGIMDHETARAKGVGGKGERGPRGGRAGRRRGGGRAAAAAPPASDAASASGLLQLAGCCSALAEPVRWQRRRRGPGAAWVPLLPAHRCAPAVWQRRPAAQRALRSWSPLVLRSPGLLLLDSSWAFGG